MKIVACLVALLAIAAATPLHPRQSASAEADPNSEGKLWAVLVAGSNSYYNYRHQADICHAYQVLHAHGVPDEQIIVMMYDDIANNAQNPTKGTIINHPDGTDVYAGVPKDYTGDSVTPENFLNVLQGNADAVKGVGSGRVVDSNSNDRIFVFFSDHGATGLIAFPNDIMTSTQLNDGIKTMFSNKRYGKMVLYIEACESGSMFDGLLNEDMNVFATTASNPSESSYACYWDDLRSAYLGDVYSVNWMEDSDAEDLSKESLEEQFTLVKKETTTSEVMQYGNVTLANMMCSEYQGSSTPSTPYRALPRARLDAVSSREVPLATLRRRLEAAVDDETRQQIEAEIQTLQRNRQFLKDKVRSLVKTVTSKSDEQVEAVLKAKSQLKDRECHESAVTYFHRKCFDLAKNSYALTYTRTITNMCEAGHTAKEIKAAIDAVCTHPSITGIY